jgi:uncharacterized protein (TIGR03435 family)
MQRVTLIAVALIATVAIVDGQAPFDAASIRPSDERRTKTRTITVTPIGIDFKGVSLLNCLEEAYGVSPHQITGPAWMRTDSYDIIARTSEPATRAQMMARLQTLLADRFNLSLHRTKRDSRVLALVVAKDGPRLAKAPDEGEGRRESAGGMALRFRRTSMPELAAYLTRQGPIGVPVVDETSLKGRFEFVLTFGPARGFGDDSKAVVREDKMISLEEGVTPFRDALASVGLGLETRRRPLEVIVIDRAERVPTAN